MDKKRKIRKSKRKQQVKRQLYFITAAVICVGIISTALILRTRKEEAKEAAAKIEQQNREKSAKENIEQEEKNETPEERLARVKEDAGEKRSSGGRDVGCSDAGRDSASDSMG